MSAQTKETPAMAPGTHRKAHMYAALIQVLLAAVSIAESFKFSYWEEHTGPGAGFVPLWLGILWLPVAGGLLWQSRNMQTAPDSPDILPRGRDAKRFGIFVLLLVGFMSSFELAGSLFSVAAFVAIALRLFEEYNWRQALVTASIMSAIFYLVFRTWLGVPLPKGVLFFL